MQAATWFWEYFEIFVIFWKWEPSYKVGNLSMHQEKIEVLRINFNMFLQKSITFTSDVLWGEAQLNLNPLNFIDWVKLTRLFSEAQK